MSSPKGCTSSSPGEYAKGHLGDKQDIKVIDGLWNHLLLTCQKGTHAVCVGVCVRVSVCSCVKNKKTKQNCRTGAVLFCFVFLQSLLSASSTDTLLPLQFYGVTFVYFMCCTDLLVHMMHIQIVRHG